MRDLQLVKDRATEYARKVVSGEVVAGLPHIQACQRHLDDIKKSHTDPEYPYVWKPSLSERIINYAETLTKEGFRRFRRSYIAGLSGYQYGNLFIVATKRRQAFGTFGLV